MLKKKVLDAYAEGSPIGLIIVSFNITYSTVDNILKDFKEESRYKRTFTDEFKKVIAQRDINGVARRQIAQELDLNVNTIKKACEQFGQAFKEKASSDNEYTRLDGDFTKDSCPSCNSKKVNEVEEDTIFCMKCGSEHIFKEDHVLKINWEYVEE